MSLTLWRTADNFQISTLSVIKVYLQASPYELWFHPKKKMVLFLPKWNTKEYIMCWCEASAEWEVVDMVAQWADSPPPNTYILYGASLCPGWLLHFPSCSLRVSWENQWRMTHVIEPLHPHGRPRGGSYSWHSYHVNSWQCNRLRSQPADWRAFSLLSVNLPFN